MNKRHPWLRLRFWHRWLGLAASLPLILAALSGAILVYKKPLINLLVTPDAALPADYSPAQIARQFDVLVNQLSQYQVNRLTAPNVQEPYWTVTLLDGSQRLYSLTTLEAYQANQWLLASVNFVHHLHTELLSGDIGRGLLLVSGLCALLLMLSGIWLWWPGRKGFRWRFVKPAPLNFKLALQLHRHSGIVIAPVLGIIVLTGSLMLWQKLLGPLLPALPMAAPLQAKQMQSQSAQHQLSTGPLLPSQALFLAQQQLPDGWPVFLRFPQSPEQDYRFRFRLQGEWHPNGRTNVTVNAKNGEIVMTPRADSLPWQYRLLNQLYPFHSSYGINALYQLLIFIAGSGLAWLSVTGLMSYVRQLRR